jgi:3-oxoacyl-[acyl-carrier-protein] synthase III
MALMNDPVLDIIAQGAWNGGTVVDNSAFTGRGMQFKHGIPVTHETIEERMGVRTRMAAPEDERIGCIALEDLMRSAEIDPGRIKLMIGATNVGEDKIDPGPLVRYPLQRLHGLAPDRIAMDLYAGCPGYNVAVELVFMLSLTGFLQEGDLSIIVGAENLHRAKAFLGTASILFGDDAMATALRTGGSASSTGTASASEPFVTKPPSDPDVAGHVAEAVLKATGGEAFDGIIVDNQLGRLVHRIPAIAARIQHQVVERKHPDAIRDGVFEKFRDALDFYDRNVDGFAFDVMTLDADPRTVESVAGAYVDSGKYEIVVSVFLANDASARIVVHKSRGAEFQPPACGVVDTATVTHGCFGDFIQAVETADGIFGSMDGKGVFQYATRGARRHLWRLLQRNRLGMEDIDLLVEHQANFAMLPLTLEQVLGDPANEDRTTAADYLADRMVTNIHNRGNCSVVCMQRLFYDLQRGALQPDRIQGYEINRNVQALRNARRVLFDSVGSGMTRSSFVYLHT